MTLLWAGQFLVDLTLVGFVIFGFRKLVKQSAHRPQPDMTAYLRKMKERIDLADAELTDQKTKMTNQLKLLNQICEKARHIMSSDSGQPNLNPSVERNELIQLAQKKEEIPTLKDLEKTQRRFSEDGVPTLKSILRDQLA